MKAKDLKIPAKRVYLNVDRGGIVQTMDIAPKELIEKYGDYAVTDYSDHDGQVSVCITGEAGDDTEH